MSSVPQEKFVPPAEPERRPAAPRSRPPVLRNVLFAIVAIAALGFGVRSWLVTRNTVTTDDAQVEGHVVPVIAKVGGYVQAVNVEENAPVHRNAVLVQIDERDLRTHLSQAEAQLASARAVAGAGGGTGEAAARLAAAKANVEVQEANARKTQADLERFRTLADHNIVSRQQLDQAEAAAAAAAAQLAAAREQVIAAGASERVAGGQLAAAQASRDEAAQMLAYASIVAPLDGVVSRKSVEVGQYVQPGQQIMNVVPLSDIWVVANLKETQLRGVSVGDAVDIRVDSDPSARHLGRVESISPATGARFSLLPPDNASGNFTKVVQRVPVRIHFSKANDLEHPLRPGMSVKVTIHTT